MSIEKAIEFLEREVREYKRMIDDRSLCLAGESAYEECQSRIDFDYEIIALLRTHPDAQPNEPLTLEELREMDGQPVWVTHKDGSGGRWGIVNIYPSGICADVCSAQAYWFEDYVGTIAYRRPPKEA